MSDKFMIPMPSARPEDLPGPANEPGIRLSRLVFTALAGGKRFATGDGR
jgi:hypothetical protein